ncbi:hypothetical protein LEP1GSC062_0584 [Leptospira alexanderi serovar Manhao 3 str. L 60]|uniref:Uncharacterized protein n=1 Tax=Leptospira alexanderi serovar Manhao 3 str. L 60 TaxID=1049759 RepID=V6I3Z3_9LEPT|nr:hypothetical protein LEP1GSC062_0584 [Leptospira alexanderi serovar Manhao 3 str. L 60]
MKAPIVRLESKEFSTKRFRNNHSRLNNLVYSSLPANYF